MKSLFSFKSIYLKFVVVFVGIIWLSSSIAFMLGFAFFKDNLITEIQQGLHSKATDIVELNNKYQIQPEDLPRLLNDDSVKITIFQHIDDINLLSEEEKAALVEGNIVESRRNKNLRLPVIVLKIQDSYLMLTTSPNKDVMIFFRNIIGIVLTLCALLGSILMVIAIRMIVRPIKHLTNATKEVAKGNFDIKIATRSQDELGQLTTNFNIMTEELKNMEYLRKDFISSVSHEFKTPMTSIEGFAKLLKEKDLTEDQRLDYTDIIISETSRLANLSNNLLRLSNLEHQSIYEKHQNFSLDEQIRKVILLLESKWSQKELELDVVLERADYLGDEELLRQVWINLIENAIKFSHQGGSLRIALDKEKDRMKVSISDSGTGIADEDSDKVFEKFYKADKSRSKEGNGLGLPIVKKIIDLHKGHVHFDSQLNIGTTFIVELPIEK